LRDIIEELHENTFMGVGIPDTRKVIDESLPVYYVNGVIAKDALNQLDQDWKDKHAKSLKLWGKDIQHFNGVIEAKDEALLIYVKEIKELKAKYDKFQMQCLDAQDDAIDKMADSYEKDHKQEKIVLLRGIREQLLHTIPKDKWTFDLVDKQIKELEASK